MSMSFYLIMLLWPNIFQYISIYFTKSWFTLVHHQLDQKQNIFINDIHWATPGLWSELKSTPEPPQKMFLSGNVIFRGLRISLGQFGQQAPESPVSQLQASFRCGLIDIERLPKVQLVFSVGILEAVKKKTSLATYKIWRPNCMKSLGYNGSN